MSDDLESKQDENKYYLGIPIRFYNINVQIQKRTLLSDLEKATLLLLKKENDLEQILTALGQPRQIMLQIIIDLYLYHDLIKIGFITNKVELMREIREIIEKGELDSYCRGEPPEDRQFVLIYDITGNLLHYIDEIKDYLRYPKGSNVQIYHLAYEGSQEKEITDLLWTNFIPFVYGYDPDKIEIKDIKILPRFEGFEFIYIPIDKFYNEFLNNSNFPIQIQRQWQSLFFRQHKITLQKRTTPQYLEEMEFHPFLDEAIRLFKNLRSNIFEEEWEEVKDFVGLLERRINIISKMVFRSGNFRGDLQKQIQDCTDYILISLPNASHLVGSLLKFIQSHLRSNSVKVLCFVPTAEIKQVTQNLTDNYPDFKDRAIFFDSKFLNCTNFIIFDFHTLIFPLTGITGNLENINQAVIFVGGEVPHEISSILLSQIPPNLPIKRILNDIFLKTGFSSQGNGKELEEITKRFQVVTKLLDGKFNSPDLSTADMDDDLKANVTGIIDELEELKEIEVPMIIRRDDLKARFLEEISSIENPEQFLGHFNAILFEDMNNPRFLAFFNTLKQPLKIFHPPIFQNIGVPDEGVRKSITTRNISDIGNRIPNLLLLPGKNIDCTYMLFKNDLTMISQHSPLATQGILELKIPKMDDFGFLIISTKINEIVRKEL